MKHFYIQWALMALYALGSWATYLLPKIGRTLPGYVKPLGLTILLAYTGWFLDTYTDWVGEALKVVYTMMLNGGGRM